MGGTNFQWAKREFHVLADELAEKAFQQDTGGALIRDQAASGERRVHLNVWATRLAVDLEETWPSAREQE